MNARAGIEEGGTAYFKTPHHSQLVTVKSVERAAASIVFSDGRERKVHINKLVPDPDYVERRAEKEAERQRRLAAERAERESKPLTHKIVIPARVASPESPPKPAPQLQLVPAPVEEKLIPKTELSNSEITRRMVALMHWWMMKYHDKKRGCVTRLEEALGISNASNYIAGRHVMTFNYALAALTRIGFDERYLRLDPFVPPDVYKPAAPAAVPAPALVASTTTEVGKSSESPQPKPAAEPTTDADNFDEDLKAWLEMSPLATLDRKIGEMLKSVTAKEADLALARKRLDDLCAKRKRLAAIAGLADDFEEAAAE